MRKRITSLLLVLALCLTLLPTAALAEASSLAAQEARDGTENGEDYTVGEDTAVRARTRAAATGEVYRISNADDLEAFCKRVNGGESSLNAVLVKDVSRNKNYSWTSIKGYTGVFDGNGHTITLRVGGSGENNALFGSIAKGGIVQDLTIQIYNWSVNISSATGSIAYSNNGTIQRCQALDWTGEKNIGGIVYHNESEGVVKDCRVGTLTLSKSRENLVGGIAFINDGLIQDCYVSGRLQSTSSGPRGDLSSATAIVRTNSGTVENCYYLQYDGETAVAGTPVTDEAAFASGEVAYKLNGKKTETDSVWRQNLPGNKDGADADGLPVADASHGRVYYDSESGSYYSLISHVHEGEELTAWQQTDSLPDASGMYYLTGNVTLTSGQALGNDVTLCVNGHSVTGNVTVTGGSFTLTDCGSGSLTGDVTVNEGGSFTLEDCALSGKIENSGTLTVTGGAVTAADGIGVENKGTFTMNSGTITAAGTGVVNNGTLTMNGGAVTGCGKGVENSGTMDVSGDVRIAGNTNGNLLLPEGITVTVGTLDSTANIGVTAEKQSELTAGGSIRLTSGGAAYTTRFFADDAAAYAIFADGEDLVMRTLGEHTHCICGHPADGAGDIGDHTTHADVTFQPWTSGNSLPTTGNYYLTQNVVLNGMTVLTGTLCLNGYTISAKDGGGPVEVSSGVLNLTDCAAQPGSVTAAKDQAIDVYSAANIFNGVIRGGSGSGIYIGPYAANGNVTIYGGKITGSGTGAAANNGTMHMYGGEISGNSRGVQAGGTKGNGSFNGSFYLHGGKITDNHGSEGGGVYVMNYFSMDGGEVSYNSATGSGGGIYVFTGKASLSGGKVTGNRAGENGGGVCTKAFRDARSYVNLSGSAEISNNYAGGRGGGVYLDVYNYLGNGNYCQLTMDGGKITGNTSVGDGGGVYADAADGNYQFRSTVNVKGGAQITGNKKGEADNNLYLPRYSEGVTIRGDLDDTADIRVTTETKPSEGSEVTIAKKSGWVSGTVTVPDGAFKVDGADGTIRIGEDGSTVKLVPHTHVWTYALKSGTTDTITAVCSGCNASGGSVTIKAPAELTYSGGDKEATLDDQLTTGVTVSASDIGYRMGAGLTGELLAGSYPRNAGTYTASITLGEGAGAVTASVTYTIGKKDLTITANGNTITYGDTAFDRGVTYKGFVDGEDAGVLGGSLTYIFSYIPGSDTGLYIIAPQGVTSDNYEITFVPGTLTVGQREVTLTWHDYENRTYGDGKTVTATAGNLLEADAGKVQVTVRDGGWNMAGSWVALADGLTGDKAGNYKLPTTGRTQEYTIGRAEQTLTFAKTGDQSLTYGETLANPATNNRADGSEVTYSSSDPAVATVDANGKVTAKNVGTTTITATAKAVDGKYSEATVSYELEVTARPIFLTITPVTYYYGQPGVSFTPSLRTVSGSLAEGDDYKTLKLSWSSVGTMWKAGTFDVNATSYNSNYNVTFDGTGKLIVLPRPITVTVDAASRVYGDADPAFTAQQTGGMGFVNGETVASLGLSLSSTATATSPVGKYDVTGTASNTNYNVTVLGEKKLTITPKAITVTVNEATRPYGEANPTFTATAPSNTLVGEDTIESLGLSLTTAADTTSPVGSYNVTGSASNTNYTVTVDGMNKLTVNPKELKANDLELTGSFVKTYDGNVNATAVGAHVKSGVLVGNDTLNITGSAVYNSEDVKDANSITFTPNAITEGNYRLAAAEKVTVTEGVKINRRTITIASVQATSKQYDGDTTAYSCITSVTFNGLVEGETLTKSGLQNGTYVTGDYGINSANFNSANVNEANKITGEVGITNPNLNYTFKESGKETSTAPFTTTGSITPANSWSLTPVTDLTIRYNNRDLRTYTPNWSTLLPSGQTWTYSASTATTGSAALSTNTIGADTGVLSYQLSAGNVSDTATWTVTASCANYQSFTLAVTLTLIARDEQTGFKFENNTTSVTKTYGDEDFTIAASGGATGSSVTYTSSDETVAKVDEDGKVTIVGAGITTIKAKASETADFEEKEISYTLTVKPKTLAKDDLTYSGSITKVYDGSTNAPSGLTVSVDPSSLVNGDTLTVNGTLKFNSANVGEASEITFIPTAITTGNYTLAATEALTIRSASITAKEVTLTSGINATNRSYAKDNKTVALTKGTLAFTGLVSGETLDVNIPDTGTIFDTKVGTYNVTYSGVTLKDGTTGKASNYKLVGSLPTVTVTISKAAAPVLADIPVSFKYTVTTGEKAIGNAGIPADAGTLTYSKGTATKTGTVTVTSWDVDSTTGKVTYTLSGGKAGDSATLFVTIASTNYEDATVNVVITLTARDNQVELRITGGTTVVYGQTLALNTSGGSGSGAVTYTVVNGTGEATIDPNTGVLTPVKVGSVSVIATKAGDNDYNAVTSAPVEITITKATPTGEPKYTEIKTGGKTLADAALTIEGSTLKPNAGTLEWVDDKGNVLSNDTKVEANTTYKWRFTPTDGNYTVLTGSIELYHKSSSGGSGWYYTYYTIKATAGTNGSISPSGWTSVRDGRDQTFTITPDKGYAVAKVLVDGKSVGAVKSYTFKNVTKDHTIEAIFMKSNGNPQTGVFVDVAEGSYYEEAIDWAVEKGITNGVSSNMFAPNDPCTRAQIVTFLWRAAGSPAPKSMSSFTDVPADAFYAKAVAWAVENGITSGTGESKFSPNSTCTRAQAVTFLYRASGNPAVSGSAEFSDVATNAYYADAVAWAAKKGITTGIGGGLFGSDNDCTRGQIVTFLWRAMAE